MIKIIVATNLKNNIIGLDNKIPWHYKEDMKFFKEQTTGNTIIMGRKTYESIGKPLPNRKNVVISNSWIDIQPENINEHLTISNNLKACCNSYSKFNKQDIFIIGGESIYKEGMDYADQILVTNIPDEVDINNANHVAYFPPIPPTFIKMPEDIILNDKLTVSTYVRI